MLQTGLDRREVAPEPGHALRRFEQPVARRSARTHILDVLYASSLVIIALLVGLAIEHLLHVQNALLVFLPVVLLAATRYGFWMAAWVSVLSVLGSSFMLAAPRLSFAVADVENTWALAIFLIAAALTSSLAAHARRRSEAADYHSRVVEQLYAFTSELADITDPRALATKIAAQLSAAFGISILLVDRHDAVLRAHAPDSETAMLDPNALPAAEACWRDRVPTGAGTEVATDCPWRFRPLTTTHGTVALAAMARHDIDTFERTDHRLRDALFDQAALQLERTRLVEEQRRNEVLAETDKLKSVLLTSISHDLRTPLASILGNVTSLRQYDRLYDAATRADMLEQTEAETRRLARFVDNLLHLSRIDAGVLAPSCDKIDLSDVVGSALQRIGQGVVRPGIVVNLDPDLPMVAADFSLMEQTLVNLIDNALKYSPKGSTITIQARLHETAIELQVVDEGPGVPAAETSRIFERFFRARLGDGQPAGMGLGLAICKGFVEAMGGSIRATNRDDRSGAVFSIQLPFERPEGHAA